MADRLRLNVILDSGRNPFIDGFGSKKKIRKARKRWRKNNPIYQGGSGVSFVPDVDRISEQVRDQAHATLDCVLNALDTHMKRMQEERSRGM